MRNNGESRPDSPAPDGGTVREYGAIILKNANHTEKMINDLKLTYQLDSGVAENAFLMQWAIGTHWNIPDAFCYFAKMPDKPKAITNYKQ